MTYNGWYARNSNQRKSYIFNIFVYIGFGIKEPKIIDIAIKPNPTKPNQTNFQKSPIL